MLGLAQPSEALCFPAYGVPELPVFRALVDKGFHGLQRFGHAWRVTLASGALKIPLRRCQVNPERCEVAALYPPQQLPEAGFDNRHFTTNRE